MKPKRSFALHSAISVFDQLLLSGLNFLIGVVLIRYATKETYGLYSQVMGVGVLSTSVLGALIGMALTTLAMRVDTFARQHMVARVARLYWLAAATLAMVAGVAMAIVTVFVDLHESALPLAMIFSLWLWTLGVREYCRTALFIEGATERVAIVDFGFVVLTLLGVVALLWMGHVTVTGIFFVMALTNALAAFFPCVALLRQLPKPASRDAYVKDARDLWALSRWAVVGSLLGWTGNNTYLYLTGGMVGVSALADLNTARLVLIPIVVLGTAWSKVAQPAMSRLIAMLDWAGLRRFMLKSLLAIEGFTAVYIIGMWVFYPWLAAHFLGAKYQGVFGLMLLWGGYFSVNAARTMTTVLLTSFGAFRPLFLQGVVSLLVLLCASLVLIPRFGVAGSLVAMVGVELLELVSNQVWLVPMVRSKYIETGNA